MSDLRHRWGFWLWSKPNTQKNGRGICLNSFLFSTDVIQNMNSSIVSRDCKKFQTTEAEAEEFNGCFFVVYESERKHMYFQFRKEVHCHELCFLFEKLPGSFIGTIRWKSSLNVSLFEKNVKQKHPHQLQMKWRRDSKLVVVTITNRLYMNWVFGLYFKNMGFLFRCFCYLRQYEGYFIKCLYLNLDVFKLHASTFSIFVILKMWINIVWDHVMK